MIIKGISGYIDPYDLLLTLKIELKRLKVDLFKDILTVRDNIKFTCPFHSNGNERTPSCFMSTEDIYKNEILVPSGQIHCFSCNYSAYITEMISHLFNKEDYGIYGKKWILSNFNTVKEVNDSNYIQDCVDELDKEIDFILHKKEPTSKTIISEKELDSYRYVVPYMYQRGLTDNLIDKFDIGYQKFYSKSKRSCITFPIKNEYGEVTHIVRRVASHKSKFYYLPKDIKPIYGLYEFLESKNDNLYICEGIFDCLTLWKWNKPSIALLGIGTRTQFNIINKLNVKNIIICFDNDNAGIKGVENCIKYINKNFKILLIDDNYKDINDIESKDIFNNMKQIDSFSYLINKYNGE